MNVKHLPPALVLGLALLAAPCTPASAATGVEIFGPSGALLGAATINKGRISSSTWTQAMTDLVNQKYAGGLAQAGVGPAWSASSIAAAFCWSRGAGPILPLDTKVNGKWVATPVKGSWVFEC